MSKERSCLFATIPWELRTLREKTGFKRNTLLLQYSMCEFIAKFPLGSSSFITVGALRRSTSRGAEKLRSASTFLSSARQHRFASSWKNFTTVSIMSGHHHHDHGDGGHCHGEHDHSNDITPAIQSLLYSQIDFGSINTLNGTCSFS